MNDDNYSIAADNSSEENTGSTINTRSSIYWSTWGEREYKSNSALSRPIGYSAQYQMHSVLNTYHYTRTFLGSASNPRGDSDRCWGWGTVSAKGSYLDGDVWSVFVHRVYYGTTA